MHDHAWTLARNEKTPLPAPLQEGEGGDVPLPSLAGRGLGQCLATMVAADMFNRREHTHISTVYGTVTTGTNWKFQKLQQGTAYIDVDEYYLKDITLLIGILVSMTQTDVVA